MPPTITALARRLDVISAELDRLPDDEFDDGQGALYSERSRLLRSLTLTPARNLRGVAVKLRLAVTGLDAGDHDEAGRLVASALRDLDRLSAPAADG
jgi:hypothetical protein